MCAVCNLADPVGQVIDGGLLDSGLRIERRRVPLGVIGVIYEARPNVTVDVASLCLKTGNAAILRGGKETWRTNAATVKVIQQALQECGLPAAAVQAIESPDRALVGEMLKMDKYIDMLIPRGGAGLHKLCREQSTIPVITGGIGVCHIFVDETAEIPRAEDHRQRQDPAAEHLQYRGNAAGAPQHRRHLPAGVKQADGRERRHPARRPFRPPRAAKRPCEGRAGESGAV